MVWRVLATIVMGLSCVSCFLKNFALFDDMNHPYRTTIIVTAYGWLWRAFIIVALWLV